MLSNINFQTEAITKHTKLSLRLLDCVETIEIICRVYKIKDPGQYLLHSQRYTELINLIRVESAYAKTLDVANHYGIKSIKVCTVPFKRVSVDFDTKAQAKEFMTKVNNHYSKAVCIETTVCTKKFCSSEAIVDFKAYAFRTVVVGYLCLSTEGCHTFNRRRYQKRLVNLNVKIVEQLGASRTALDLLLNSF